MRHTGYTGTSWDGVAIANKTFRARLGPREELKRVRAKLERLAEEHKRFVESEFWTLVTDGLQKAERTRSMNRIGRIAKILANAAVEGPSKPADMTEELMRVAMDTNDEDACVLAKVVNGQRGPMLPGARSRF